MGWSFSAAGRPPQNRISKVCSFVNRASHGIASASKASYLSRQSWKQRSVVSGNAVAAFLTTLRASKASPVRILTGSFWQASRHWRQTRRHSWRPSAMTQVSTLSRKCSCSKRAPRMLTAVRAGPDSDAPSARCRWFAGDDDDIVPHLWQTNVYDCRDEETVGILRPAANASTLMHDSESQRRRNRRLYHACIKRRR